MYKDNIGNKVGLGGEEKKKNGEGREAKERRGRGGGGGEKACLRK